MHHDQSARREVDERLPVLVPVAEGVKRRDDDRRGDHGHDLGRERLTAAASHATASNARKLAPGAS